MTTLRTRLVRLAHQHPELRVHLVPMLREKQAKEFRSDKEYQKYLKEHPGADRRLHKVVKTKERAPKHEEKPKDKGKKKPEEKKPESKGVSKWLGDAKKKFKDVASDIAGRVQKAPAGVQRFIADTEHRNKTLKAGAQAIAKSPKKILSALVDSAKSELHELKHAGHAVKKAVTGKKLDKKDMGALYSAGLYVAGGVLAGMTGGVAGAAMAIGHSFKLHVAIKAVSKSLDQGFLHFEGVETVQHAMHLLASTRQAASVEDMPEDELHEHMLSMLMQAVLEELNDGISDDDMAKILAGDETAIQE